MINQTLCQDANYMSAHYISSYYKMTIPQGYCPGHEGKMDWDEGQGTVFKPTGRYKEEIK